METTQLNQLEEYVPIATSLLNLLEHVHETGLAVSTSLYGKTHHVRPVKSGEDFRALKVTLDTGLYALYQRTPSGAWESV